MLEKKDRFRFTKGHIAVKFQNPYSGLFQWHLPAGWYHATFRDALLSDERYISTEREFVVLNAYYSIFGEYCVIAYNEELDVSLHFFQKDGGNQEPRHSEIVFIEEWAKRPSE